MQLATLLSVLNLRELYTSGTTVGGAAAPSSVLKPIAMTTYHIEFIKRIHHYFAPQILKFVIGQSG